MAIGAGGKRLSYYAPSRSRLGLEARGCGVRSVDTSVDAARTSACATTVGTTQLRDNPLERLQKQQKLLLLLVRQLSEVSDDLACFSRVTANRLFQG